MLLALILAASGFLQPVELRVHASEASDPIALLQLCHLPGAQLELQTRSNMLEPTLLASLRRCNRPIVQWREPLLEAHLAQLQRWPGAELLFDLPENATLSWTKLSALGPHRLHLRVRGRLTAERAKSIARFRNVEIELDLRGRVPDADELAALLQLDRASRSLHLRADAPPELVAGLAAVRPGLLVVDAVDNEVPQPLLQALIAADLPTRVELVWPFTAANVKPLAAIRRLSVGVELGTIERVPGGLTRALAPVEPDLAPPAVETAAPQ